MKSRSDLDSLKIDSYGNIQNWPENFFGDEMGDITEQAKAAMKKLLNQSSGGSEVEAGGSGMNEQRIGTDKLCLRQITGGSHGND